MKQMLALFVLIAGFTAQASSLKPELCSDQDLQNLTLIWKDMENNGFDQSRLEKGIGISAGDCIAPYTLEEAAGRPHRADAPRPSCGLVVTLSYDEATANRQAAWILDTVGSTYQTSEGVSLPICSKGSSVGPYPGATVHN
jgi:hypothetical protein